MITHLVKMPIRFRVLSFFKTLFVYLLIGLPFSVIKLRIGGGGIQEPDIMW